ncbi:MAG: peptide-methionine (S)-S-oxide reductase MsrA [Verrucomicrobiia bacterium]
MNATESSSPPAQKLVLGAGCFWCVEGLYEDLPGVLSVVSGYAGGKEANPTYELVTSKKTDHAEVVEITFDPSVVTAEKLLEIFWASHDPTDPRGVAPDFGRNYRSILLYANQEQKELFERSKAAIASSHNRPIATEIVALEAFWPAEDYHQDFVARNPRHPYVQRVSKPRIEETHQSIRGK